MCNPTVQKPQLIKLPTRGLSAPAPPRIFGSVMARETAQAGGTLCFRLAAKVGAVRHLKVFLNAAQSAVAPEWNIQSAAKPEAKRGIGVRSHPSLAEESRSGEGTRQGIEIRLARERPLTGRPLG